LKLSKFGVETTDFSTWEQTINGVIFAFSRTDELVHFAVFGGGEEGTKRGFVILESSSDDACVNLELEAATETWSLT